MPLPKAWENYTRVDLDFESYFENDTGYSLRNKKDNMSDYVRDERFKAHLVTVKVDKGATELVMHKDLPKYLKALRKKHKKIMLIAHNMHFDGLICSHRYGFVPDAYVCTLSMARYLHGKEIRAGLGDVATHYKRGNKMPDVLDKTRFIRDLEAPEHQHILIPFCAYSIKDTDLCSDIFDDMLPHVPADEMEVMHHVLAMFCNPVLQLNRPLAEQAQKEEIERRRAIIERVILQEEIDAVRNGEMLNLTRKERAELTPYQIGQKLLRNDNFMTRVLAEYGIEVPKKFSAKQKKVVPSFAKDGLVDLQNSLDMDAEGSDEVWDLLQGRIDANSTITVSRAERLLRLAANGWAMPVGYHYGKTVTNRLAGANKTNFQNFGRGSKLRRAIEAMLDNLLAVMDSSQIEARCLPYIAGFEEKLNVFRQYDIITGAVLYLKSDMKKPPKERRTKVVKFSGATRDELLDFVTHYLINVDEFKEFDRAGPDVYRVSASGIYSKHVDEVGKDERQIGKVGELALGYGGADGAFNSMARNYGVKLPETMVRGIVRRWRKTNKPIEDLWGTCTEVLEHLCSGKKARGTFGGSDGTLLKYYWKGNVACIELPSGFTVKYPGLAAHETEKFGRPAVEYRYSTVEGDKYVYGGLMTENITQALARDVVFWQCLQLIREFQHRGVRWVMSTHDEGVFHIPEALKQEFMRRAVHWFFSAPPWAADLPVAGDGGVATNYSK